MHSAHYNHLCFDLSCEMNAQHAIQIPAKNKTGVTKDELGRGIYQVQKCLGLEECNLSC